MLGWYLVSEWILRVVMIPVVARRRSLTSALSWLCIIFLVPWIGALLYLFLAEHFFARHVKRHRKKVRESRKRERRILQDSDFLARDQGPEAHELATLTEKLGGFRLLGGNEVSFHHAHEDAVDRLVEDIDAASDHVHLLFYLIADDACGCRVADALLRARQRGVTCRVLADSIGSRKFFRSVAPDLEEQGISCHRVLPLGLLVQRLRPLDLRNHRKLAIIDGRVGYTGSMNLVDARSRTASEPLPWRDLMVRVRGPVVHQLQLLFQEDWVFNAGEELPDEGLYPPPRAHGAGAAQVVPSDPTSRMETFHKLLVAALNHADERVIITTPYVIPDGSTLVALRLAALRGARVDIVVPVRSDSRFVTYASRSHLGALLEAGIHVHHHETGFLHAKTVSVDRKMAMVGSANFDRRSFYLNFELNLALYDTDAIDRLVAIQEVFLEEASPIDAGAWRKRPWPRKVGEDMARLLSPLL